MPHVDIVFDGPPGLRKNPGFIEVEDCHGNSTIFGKWLRRPDGVWVLRIHVQYEHDEEFQASLPRSEDGMGGGLSIVHNNTECGCFSEANWVTITDGERTAVYVPLSPVVRFEPKEGESLPPWM